MKLVVTKLLVFSFVFSLSVTSWGKKPKPPTPSPKPPAQVQCVDHGKNLDIINEQVLIWKEQTPNQFLARARVKGLLTKNYGRRNGHEHFQIQLGKDFNSTLEVIYNEDFGALPELVPGASVEACGDYITSDAPTSQYPASPDGAIIHWVHRSNNEKKHNSGYVIINGKVFGYKQTSF